MRQFLEKLGPYQAQGTCRSGALKTYTSPIQSYASAVVPDSFSLPSQQSAILASLEKEYGVFHGLIPDLELRRSKIQKLYGL